MATDFESKDKEVASIGPDEFRVGPFIADAGIEERLPLKGAVPAAWLAVAGEGGDQGGVNGQLRTAPEWEACGDHLAAAVVNPVNDQIQVS